MELPEEAKVARISPKQGLNNVIKEVKDFLFQGFEMKDLGEAHVILNIKLVKKVIVE